MFSSKRRVVVAAALVLLALFMLRPGASRLKSRIILSLSAAVGRPTDIGAIHIRLLPRPGFDLENLVVYEDPSFGAEPMLRASEVTADLRLTSLLRGRLEIARLDLTEPSLNLVHNQSGKWNLETLLERTAQMPLAPTAKAKSEPRPAFPYIEASSARINFKNGQEKKPYALTNADFSLWQESENTWGVRLKAQPVRTDLNLNDTGQLQLSGIWQRAASLRDTPLQFSIEWSRAQLGQVSKLFTGIDRGWRGAILLDGKLTGTPANLQISSTASIDDFRRYDITTGRALRLRGTCDAAYSSVTQEFHEVNCTAPIAKGFATLRGSLGLPGSRYSVDVRAQDIPASALAALAQCAKKNLPDDLAAEGTLRGNFSFRQDDSVRQKSQFQGQGEIAGFRLSSVSNKAEIEPQTVPFALRGDASKRANAGQRTSDASQLRFPAGPHIEFGPVSLDAGRGGAIAQGWINRDGYGVAVTGLADIAKELRNARIIGLPASPATPEGSAQIGLRIAGFWAGQNGASGAGFQGPQVTGMATLRNLKIAMRGVGPVEIVSADMELSSDSVRVARMNARAAGTTWTGSLMLPRGCGHPETCPITFALNTGDASFAQLNEWAHPGPKKRAWYQVLEGNTPTAPSFLARLQASGSIKANRLQIGSVDVAHISARLVLDRGTLNVPELNADFLGGRHRGTWHADFNSKPALCGGSGQLAGVSLARLASAMKDPWIVGTATANYQIRGSCTTDFWRSAEGTLRVEMRDGAWHHISLGTSQEPLQFTRFSGQADLNDGKIELSNTNVDSPEGKYEISGTATLQREISLKMTRQSASTGYAISGTIAEPLVTPLGRTEQARLKTPPAK